MRLFRIARRLRALAHREEGVAFIETIVALALLGAVAVCFLSGLATTSKAVAISDGQTTAESLAQGQMEWAKRADYAYEATEYSAAPIPGGKDYINYSAVISAEPLHSPDDGIQKITVTVKYSEEDVIRLQGYKVDR